MTSAFWDTYLKATIFLMELRSCFHFKGEGYKNKINDWVNLNKNFVWKSEFYKYNSNVST